MSLLDREDTADTGRTVYSVTEINRLARELIEDSFAGIIVEGEISGLKRYPSGHWYFSLKDRDAQLRCVMFRGSNISVRFQPGNGDQVSARGSLTIYQSRGDFQLKVAALEKSGSGELRRAFELLKARLQTEGLFAQEAKKPVGTQFRHIGIITSPSGAVLRDMLTVFRRRYPSIRITLIPVAVQGEQAPAEIRRAIETANALSSKLGLEALIVGRGGGSPEDLQTFNEEIVARAIFASKLPVTSAVGHEADFCIADFVSDLRAPTPSAAAELMSPSREEHLERLRSDLGKLQNRMRQRIREKQENFRLISQRLRNPEKRLQDHAQALDELYRRLDRAARSLLRRKQHKLDLGRQGLRHSSPQSRLSELRARLTEMPRRLRRSVQVQVEARRALLAELGRTLRSTGPMNTLARGYSITMDESAKVIRSVDDVTQGTGIITRLPDGRLKSTVLALAPESKTEG